MIQKTKNRLSVFLKDNRKKSMGKILKESIIASEQLYSFEETKVLYEELARIEPTDINYFAFAGFLLLVLLQLKINNKKFTPIRIDTKIVIFKIISN